MPKYFSHSLPYRRLQKFANGIWDEERKTFYPWRIANSTVAAKSNIRYFVHSVSCASAATGISAGAWAKVTVTVNGVTASLGNAYCTSQTLATDYFSVTSNQNPDVLCDVNTALTMAGTVSVVLYAEIPADPVGGPVVIT